MGTAVITGSTQGIGRGLAEAFCRKGFNVVVSGRNQERLNTAVNELGALGNVSGLACDVGKAPEVQALWDHATQCYGKVDIWVNNAGLARTVWPMMEVPQGELEAMIHTNMLGTINGCRVALAGMLAQGSGKLFNMLGGGSDGEYFPGLGMYGTTKRGLNYFTDALVKEHKDAPVIIAKIRPGMVITEAVIREAKADLENFEKSRSTMNNLVDTVETVCPYLVEQMLACEKSGSKIRWLTGGKIAGRMLLGQIKKRPDQFEQYGL